MLERLNLRLRVFLFFGLLAAGGLAIAAGALALGWTRGDAEMPIAPFVTAFVVFALLNTGLLLGVWLLFDENVAKPINRLSAELRMRAHSDTTDELDVKPAQYLGDLAPAAAALSTKVETDVDALAASVARETERLSSEHRRLSALLTESPIATLLINPAGEIVLYDAQAARILSQIGTPRLKAPLTDYFTVNSVNAALSGSSRISEVLRPCDGSDSLNFRVKALNDDGHMLFCDPVQTEPDTIAARPLVFDFDLMSQGHGPVSDERPLSELCCVVFDLETTGLSVQHDNVVQVGAVRILNGDLVQGEEFSSYVNPGCLIPPASTRIHHVTDADVLNAPTFAQAGRALNEFARNAVLVAHNAPFDFGFLKRHEAETGVPWDHPVLDTVLLSAVAFGTTEEHSLDALCERFGIQIEPEDRHTALGDARATGKALVHLLRMLEGQGHRNLKALQPLLDQQALRLYASV